MKLATWIAMPAIAAVAMTALVAGPAIAEQRVVKIAGFGAKSGPVRSFGVNSEVAMRAAADAINKKGGIKLGDGTMAKIVISYDDDRCNAEDGINILRRLASGDSLVAIAPTCSNVAEPMFGILQKKVGDTGDSGLKYPIFTDVAVKGGLAKISEWAFRNVPSEADMYKALFAYLKQTRPELKTIYGGVEDDFAHSKALWHAIMKVQAPAAGYELKGEAKWLLADTNFQTQVRDMKAANADIVAISAHPFTTCGVLKEMQRQGVKPKLIIGLTSSSSLETMQGCAKQAEGVLIPTSFAPVNKDAQAVADVMAKNKGSADLHSTAAWENMFILKDVMEKAGIMAKADTVAADRDKIRAGLQALTETKGLLGVSKRTPDREAQKPFVFVEGKSGKWVVKYDPSKTN
ncbi:MAG: ABC transporter substrate-binding protein [Alphaproteobacteria bacterium]